MNSITLVERLAHEKPWEEYLSVYHGVFASMLRCVHGIPFKNVRVRKNASVQCLHCSEMHTGTVWYSQCCLNNCTKAIENHCILCNGCMSKLSHLGQLEDFNYHEHFKFEFTAEEQRRRVSAALQKTDYEQETLAYDDE